MQTLTSFFASTGDLRYGLSRGRPNSRIKKAQVRKTSKTTSRMASDGRNFSSSVRWFLVRDCFPLGLNWIRDTYGKSKRLKKDSVSNLSIIRTMAGPLTIPVHNRSEDTRHKTLQGSWNWVEDLAQHCHGHDLVGIFAPSESILKFLFPVSAWPLQWIRWNQENRLYAIPRPALRFLGCT